MPVIRSSASIMNAIGYFDFYRQEDTEIFKDIMQEYTNLLKLKWESFMHQAIFSDTAYENGVQEAINLLSEEEFGHFLVKPEISSRLLEDGNVGDPEVCRFFAGALACELAKKTHRYASELYGSSLWTANGDYLIAYDGLKKEYDEFNAPALSDNIVIDFFSPYCLKLSQEDINESATTIFECYSQEEAENIFNFLEQSIAPLTNQKHILYLINKFNNVILVKKQLTSDRKQVFISGSDGNYIGRTHVMNPEIVREEFIAEMLVHEAIHSVLYMVEELENWMPAQADALRIGISVISNWSGNSLSVRSYFQAIYVWYGIFNFWLTALRDRIYDRKFILNRLEFISRGFVSLDINQIIKSCQLQISDLTIESVQHVKRRILDRLY
jgi:hypothetical protein